MRPLYTEADESDRRAYILSRTDILSKTFVTDLWTRVITRAIEDIILYRVARAKNKRMSDEDIIFEESAYGFLFDSNWRVPIENYKITLICNKIKCEAEWTIYISDLDNYGKRISCPYGHKNNRKKIEAYIAEDQIVKHISLEEILEAIGINDINGFRNGCRREIEKAIDKKLNN